MGSGAKDSASASLSLAEMVSPFSSGPLLEATSAGIYSKHMAGENEISLDALGTATVPAMGAVVAVPPTAVRGN